MKIPTNYIPLLKTDGSFKNVGIVNFYDKKLTSLLRSSMGQDQFEWWIYSRKGRALQPF